MPRRANTPQGILSRRQVSDAGCWEYTGALHVSGYAYASLLDVKVSVHRLAYKTFVGPIPDGLEIDHLCRNRACFNPAHLEAVTTSVNVLRAIPYAKRRFKARGSSGRPELGNGEQQVSPAPVSAMARPEADLGWSSSQPQDRAS